MTYEVFSISSHVKMIRQYVIPDCPTNCYVIFGSSRNFVVDTGFGSTSADIINGLLDKAKETLVINTHYHWDHIWGNHSFISHDIIGHHDIKGLINTNWESMVEKNRASIRGTIECAIPNMLVRNELWFGDDGLYIFGSRGHSSDGLSVFIEQEGLLIAGDNIGDNGEEIVPALQDSIPDYLDCLEKYKSLRPKIILSGHNEPAGIDILDRIAGELSG